MDKTTEPAEQPKFLRVTEVASLLECSESHAYACCFYLPII